MMNILFSWIGTTDLRAQSERDAICLGPLAQAATSKHYDSIVLISDYAERETFTYKNWLQSLTDSPIFLRTVALSSPTHFGEIYQAVTSAILTFIEEIDENINLTFHLSPGTPAMAAVWVILAKTRFPAELIESSKQNGVRIASVPFDISADYIPDLLRKPDKNLENLAAGLSLSASEFDGIIHRSEVMQRIILKARRIAPRSIPV